MSDQGISLACKYSYVPNKLGYCGPAGANEELLDYIVSGIGESNVVKLLKRFEGLYPYLKLIAEKNGKMPFDFDVVEAYWIGNELLENISTDDLKNLIVDDFSVYLTKSVAKELADDVPKDAKAHHSFHVLHILSLRSLTGRVPAGEDTLEKCAISCGKVINTWTDLKVNVNGINRNVQWEKKLLSDVKVGDIVSIHWNLAVEVLVSQRVENLRKYADINSRALESSGA